MTDRSHRGRRAAVGPDTREGSRIDALGRSRVARALIAHEHRTAAALLALLVLAYLWPVLVGGKLLAPTALVSIAAPWNAGMPKGLLHYMNGELGDVPATYYPWNVLARQLIHAGTFPAWNPYAYGGTPLFANVELAWLSPFSLPLWLLPLHDGLAVAAALKLWMAGFGTYLLVRELRLGFWPAIVAAVSFALCAFNVVWLTYGVFLSVAALLPWSLWLVERIVRRGRALDGLALAAVVAALLAGGHPGTQLHVLAATVLYALARAFRTAGLERRDRLLRLGMAGGAVVVGALLMAVVLLPGQQAAIDTHGALVRENGAAAMPGTHAPYWTARTALFPDWWGRPSEHLGGDHSNYKERTYYAGVIPLLLAALALVTAGGWRRKAPFAALGLLGLLIPLRTPLLYDAVIHLPLFGSVQNQRILLWFLFAVAVLAAFGLQAVLDNPRERRIWSVLGVGLLAAMVALATIDRGGEALGSAARYVARRSDGASDATLALASVAWWLIPLLALAGLLLAVRARPRWRAPAGALVALLVALDLLRFAHGYNPMGPPSLVVPPRTPAIAFLQRHAGDRRIAGTGQALFNDWATIYGLRDARGYDAPQPTLRFARLWREIEPSGDVTFVAAIAPSTPKLLGMLGTRYVLTEPGGAADVPGLTPVYRGGDATIFANALAVPRAFVASRVRVAGDEDAEIAAVTDGGFDPRRDAVVRGDELHGAAPPQDGAGDVRVVADQNDRVELEATLAQRSLVVLADQWMDGWTVRIDGRPAPLLQTDVVLRGVVVPAGRHEIEWSYRVPGLRAGAALSAIGLVAFLGWGGWVVVKSRRRRGLGRGAAG